MLKAILLGLLALLILLILLVLLLPLRFHLKYRNGESEAWLQLFLVKKIPLSADQEEKPPPKQKPPAPTAEEAPKKKMSGQKLMDLLTMISDILPTLGKTMSYILHRIILRQCDITMVVGEEEAADTAILVGKINAVGYSVYTVLCSYIRVKAFRFHISPDFVNPGQRAAADICVSVRPSSLLMGGLILLVKEGGRILGTLAPGGKKKKKKKGTAPKPTETKKVTT